MCAMLFCSCNKNHYDVSQIHGVQAEGGWQLPIMTASYSIGDLLTSFQMDSVILFDEDGGLRFEYDYIQDDVLKGSDFMKFNGFVFDEHYAIPNPYPFILPQPIDTVVKFDYSVNLESDHVTVESGKLRSGLLSFDVETNVAHIKSMVIRSNEIRREDGSPLEISTVEVSNPIEIDLSGLYFESEETHVLNFSHEMRVSIDNASVSEFAFDIHLAATDIDIQEMTGYVERFELRSSMDTAFSLFNENVTGSLALKGAKASLLERNSFGLAATLVVDTAWILSEGLGHYSFFDPMPIEAELYDSPSNYIEALSQSLNATVNSNSIGMYLSSNTIFNPNGMNELVSLTDTSSIDLALNVNIPFSFRINDVQYKDTVDMKISGVDMPEMIEELTVEMTFNSTLPLNLNGRFYLYDSQQDVILDELVTEGELIAASFDGRPVTTNVSVTVTEERLQKALQADGLIMMYEVDTDARDVSLNTSQRLEAFVKAKVKYNGNVEF